MNEHKSTLLFFILVSAVFEIYDTQIVEAETDFWNRWKLVHIKKGMQYEQANLSGRSTILQFWQSYLT